MLLDRLGSLFQPDPNEPKGYATKDEIAEKRKLARQLMTQGASTAPVSNGWEGLARILGAVNGAVQDYQAKREDRDAYGEARKREAALFGGDPTTPAVAPAQPMNINPMVMPVTATTEVAGVGGGGIRSPGAAGVVKPIEPAQSNTVSGAFINTVKAGGLTNPYGLAAVGATGERESGWSPQRLNAQWADPSESGAPGTSGGALSWRAERLAALRSFAAKNGDKGLGTPETQAKFFLQEDPGLVQRLNAAKSPEEAMSHMNNAWRFAGYDRPGGERDARITAAQRWAARPDLAANGAQPSAGLGSPVQVAQAAPQSAGPSIPALMSIMNDERASPGAKAAAQLMLQRRIASENKDPTAAALQQEQLRAAQRNNREAENAMETQVIGGNLYERRKGTTDTWKLSIKKAEEDATPKRSLQPIYGVDAEGNTVLLQPDDAGNANQMKLPAGVKVTPGTQRVDTGTEILTVDTKTGNVIGRVKKDVAGVEVQKTIGEAQGKVAVAAPSAISTAEQTLKDIEGIKKHPSMSDSFFGGGLGAPGTVFRSIPGTQAYGFNQRIEQLKGKTFMEAYNGLRGGGAITDAEGAKATQALARLNAAQSAKDFNEALSDLESVVKSGLERAKGMGAKFGTTITDGASAAPVDLSAAPQVRKFNPSTGRIE